MDKAVLITIFYILKVILDALRELTLMKGMASYESVKESQEQVYKILEALYDDEQTETT